jgi:hypothetical protein
MTHTVVPRTLADRHAGPVRYRLRVKGTAIELGAGPRAAAFHTGSSPRLGLRTNARPASRTRTRTRVGVIGGAHGSRGRPTGIALAALSLALAQPTAPDLWLARGPKNLERSA